MGTREPWEVLGQRNDSWPLRKQGLSLTEPRRWPSEHAGHECAGSWCKRLLCTGELLCCDSARACASVSRVAACPGSVLHVPASEGAGQREVAEACVCVSFVGMCVGVCMRGRGASPHVCARPGVCVCVTPPPGPAPAVRVNCHVDFVLSFRITISDP